MLALLIIYRTVFKIYIMKKILLFIFTFFSFYCFLGQGNNLQFSQVLNFNFNHTTSANWSKNAVGTITVPNNKAWKITSGDFSKIIDHSGQTYLDGGAIFINDIAIAGHALYANNPFNYGVDFPYWLASGTYNVYLKHNTSSTNSYTLYGSLSIIEFNIVQ
jgi:hypothetical protein